MPAQLKKITNQKEPFFQFIVSPKRIIFFVISAFIFTTYLVVTFNSEVSAATGINRTINFQGKVVNSDGTNVADGLYTFVFKLHDAPFGGANPWTETQNNVQVTAGVFRVSLGSVTTFASAGVDFNTDNLYLGINFNSDGEMTPRVRFAAVPYAINAEKVAGLTVTNTTGTLTIPNSTTVQFGGAFTTSAEDLTLTLTDTTNVTLPTTGTLATLAGVENLSNKTFTNSITLSGAGSNLVLANSESISNDTNGTLSFGRNDAGTVTLTAADNDATAALTILSGGASVLTLDTGGGAALNLGTTNATSAVLGSAALASFTVTTTGTGDTAVVLPSQSISSSEILDNTLDFTDFSSSMTLDTSTTVSLSTLDYVFDLTSTGEFEIRDAGNTFAYFGADGTITFGKAASGGTLNLGVGTGADVINIGDDNTSGDTIVIGNDNASSTLSLTGGDDWSVTSAGNATFAAFYGAGLSDCDAATSKLLWNDASGTFSCGTDMGSNLQVVDFTDSTTEVATFATAMDIWDGTYPNITPGSTNSEILISVNIRGTSDDAGDQNPVFQIRRAIGSNPVCTGTPSTAVGGEFAGGWVTNTGHDWGATVTTSDAPASTGNVRYTVCTTTTGLEDGNTDVVNVVLTEIGSSSGGGGSGNVSVRESDSSPSVATASTIEFGPATTSSDEFIVTDEGSGVARIRLGDQVGLLNEAETITGGWTFDTTSTTFTTGIIADGGLFSSSGSDLSLSAGGTGDIEFNLDADSNLQITGTQAPGVDIVSLLNTGQGTTTNGVDALQIDFETSAIAGNRENAALRMNLISGATEAGDSLYGLFVGNLTGQTGVETAMYVGTGWDVGLLIDSGGATIASGALAVNSGSITSNQSTLTINAGGTVEIQDNLTVTGATGLTLSSTGDISLAGGSILDSVGNVLIDDDLEVSGDIIASAWDAAGASALSIGSGDVLSLSVITDSTGDSEVVLPDESIGSAEITNDSLTPTDFAQALTFSDGDFIDLSSILHDDASLQGLRLPQAGSLTAPVSGEGFLAYNSTTNLVQVFDGSNWVSIAGGGGGVTLDDVYADSLSALDTILDIDDSSGMAFNLSTTGNFVIQDAGTSFVEFQNDGTISLGKASVDSIINIGIGTGIDTINIGTGATGADVISIGNAAGTVAITGTNFDLSSAGILTMSDELILSTISGEGISGGGLTDCDGATDKLQWDSSTNQFVCGTDSNFTAVFDAYDNTGGDNVSTGVTVNLDTVRKNSDGTVYSLASDVLTIDVTGTYTFHFRVGATLTAGTRGAIRAYLEEDSGSGFAEVEGTRAYAYGRITTYPEATAVGFVTMDVTAGDQFRVRSLVEAGSFSTVADGSSLIVSKVAGSTFGGGGGINGVNVRESDGSPTVTEATTIEFGPASSSTDEFIVSDEGSGVARVRLGNQVGLLNEGETVTGGWTFSTGDSTFTTSILANGGLNTTSNTNLSLAAHGTGNIVLSTDADSGVNIGSASSPAPLSISGGIGNNAALIVNNTNLGDVFAASSSGTTVFRIDSSGSLHSSGGINLSTGTIAFSSTGDISLAGGTILDSVGNVLIDDDLEVSGGINLSTGTIAFSSTGDISLAGGTISDSVGDVLINDNLSIAGTTGLTFTSTGGINLAGGTISDTSDEVDINDDLAVAGNVTLTGTTGLTFSGVGADLIFANSESIDNDTNGTITFGRNDAGIVTITSKDNDATAALTINSGGAAALTLDTGGGAALSVGGANATSVVIGNTTGGFGLTFNTGTGTLNIGDVATTKAIEIGGVDSDGGDTVRIATNATSADSINIGNANSSTTMALTGGDDWSITTAGAATFASFDGAGLSADCDTATSSKVLWDTTTNTFSCGTDNVFNQSKIFTDTTSDVSVSWTTDTDIWDGTQPNMTVTNTNNRILVSFTANIVTDDAADEQASIQIRRDIGAAAGCTDTQVGESILGTFLTTANQEQSLSGTFLDTGSFTASDVVNYTLCTGGHANDLDDGTVLGLTVTLLEVGPAGADLAEVYYSDESIVPGEVVELDPTGVAKVKKTDRPYSKNAIGIVSTNPGMVLGTSENLPGKPVMVALSGRVPVKVTTENGTIRPGDYLTSSSIRGVAMKATKAGIVIGQSMETYEGEGVGSVMTFVKNTHTQGEGRNQLLAGLFNEDLASFSEKEKDYALISSILNDSTTLSSEISTDVVVAGLKVVTGELSAVNANINNISVFDGNELTVELGDEGSMVLKNQDSETVVAFDNLGNANFAGTITADKVIANEIQGLELLVNSSVEMNLLNNFGMLDQGMSLFDQVASISARLQKMEAINLLSFMSDSTSSGSFVVIDNLASYGTATFAEASVLESLSIGNGMSISQTSINTLGEDLEIQPLAQAGVSFLGGKVKFESDGRAAFYEDVVFAKNVAVEGVLSAKTITTSDLRMGRGFTTVISETEVSSTGAAGMVTLRKDRNHVKIINPLVKESSYIFVTPKSLTTQPIFLVEQIERKEEDEVSSFTVGIEGDAMQDILFNYLIVN